MLRLRTPTSPDANVQPPTTAMVALALAQCGVLGLVERSGVLARVSPRVEGVLGVVNALTVTVYLWHIPVIFVAGGLLLGVVEAIGMHFTSPSLKSLLSYGIFIAVLLLRPNGLFHRKR